MSTTMPPLEIVDYKNILSLARGKTPLWTIGSLIRCNAAGLVNPKGDFLTREGRRKGQRLVEYVTAFQAGLPFSARTINRAHELIGMPWNRIVIDFKKAWFNHEVIFQGAPPKEWGGGHITKRSPDDPQFTWVSDEIRSSGLVDGRTLMKLTPYAVQLDHVGGHEVICMKYISLKNGRPKGVRIQSRYFDYLERAYSGTTWWFNTGRQHGPIIVKNTHGLGWKNKIYALVMPVVAKDWPLPDVAEELNVKVDNDTIQNEFLNLKIGAGEGQG